MKFLLDTNVFVHLEDNKSVDSIIYDFIRIASENNCSLLIHPSSKKDINKDKNKERKQISLAKIQKYEVLKNPAPILPELKTLAKKDNDLIDGDLLSQVKYKYVDYLVTYDKGIHKKAIGLKVTKQVITPEKAVEILKNSFSITIPEHPSISHHSTRFLIPKLDDSFFDSLRADYDFNDWIINKCATQDRMCYSIEIKGKINALLIYNLETYNKSDHPFLQNDDDLLKMCTVKVTDNALGKKIGELFINKMIQYCVTNKIKNLYVTTYENQTQLINLFEYYGFILHEFINKQGKKELALYKDLDPKNIDKSSIINISKNHPFYSDKNVNVFIIPIQPKYYDTLFKDGSYRNLTLFDESVESLEEVEGNSIKKAYLSLASNSSLNKGDVLYFYVSKKSIIEPIGIVEDVLIANNFNELKSIVKKITVYKDNDLKKFFIERKKVTVIIFRLVTYLDPPIKKVTFSNLKSYGAKFVTIIKVNSNDYNYLKQNGGIDERFIID